MVAGSEAWEEARDTGLEVCGEGYLSSPGQYSERGGDDIRHPALKIIDVVRLEAILNS